MDADVVVVGGGPVGASLGILLRRQGVDALVLDRAEFPRDKPCGEGLMPSGARVLAALGVDLAAEGFPPLDGVRYRLAGGASARGRFRSGPGFGVRRVRLDAVLAERAAVRGGVAVGGLSPARDHVLVETSLGALRARVVVGADGLRSRVRRWLGWERAPRPPHRHALVGHWQMPDGARPGARAAPGSWEAAEIVVTLLDGVEVYAAPAGGGELLVAVLGSRGTLRLPGLGVADGYRELASRAHPELAWAPLSGRVWGAGPFRTVPATVAADRVFLAGDAAGFLDPLTGDAMSAGLGQAAALARFLAADLDQPAAAARRYRRWWRAQWRRRRLVGRLALALTGSPPLAARALAGVERRPAALQSLLEVNDGSRGLRALGPRDWAALAGL